MKKTPQQNNIYIAMKAIDIYTVLCISIQYLAAILYMVSGHNLFLLYSD